METITDKQRGKIFALRAEQGMSEDTLYGIVYEVSGQDHISGLSKLQAIKVIDWLSGKSVQADRATKKQIWMIERLAEEVGLSDKKRLYGLIKKRFKIDVPEKDPYRWINTSKASAIIEALKDMKERNYLKENKQ